MATEPKGKVNRVETDQAKTEVIPGPPPKWLIELAKQTCEQVDQANRRIEELNRKYGR